MTRRIGKPDTSADIEVRQFLDAKNSFVMIAGAGSGKTTSLVKALDYIGKTQGEALRKSGQKVACITYTTVAEAEIWSDVGHDPLFHVSTIHSFLWQLIKPFQVDIKTWVSGRIQEKLDELDQERMNFSNKHRQSTKDKNLRDTAKYQNLRDRIASVNHFRYETGSNYLEGVLGHDDILKLVPNLIKARPLLKVIVAQKYPFIFIDESQDTIPEVVEAIKSVALYLSNKICLGFFGDEMQKIYTTGIGKIGLEVGWKQISKPENFRCPVSVLNVINSIRSPVDGLVQTVGRIDQSNEASQQVMGTARLFLFPSNADKSNALHKVRKYISTTNDDPSWLSDEMEADIKILVIEHRMAANRLGFPDLYSAFKDNAPKSFSEDFTEGKTWALRPFQNYLIPLVVAFDAGKNFEVLELLREYSPALKKESLHALKSPKDVLKSLKDSIQQLSVLMAKTSKSTVLDVLKFATSHALIRLDDRIYQRMHGDIPVTLLDATEDEDAIEKSMRAYFNCSVAQLWGYQIYVDGESPFSTQHSIKGSEFERVMVVLDDEEGKKSTQYSYDKLFGIKPPSDTDKKNQKAGKDSVLDRTRRLLYVCCSRAVRDLAVVFFVSDVALAEEQIRAANIFNQDSIVNNLDVDGI